MTENLKQIQKQTYRYYYEDGLVEIAVGSLFVVIGLNTWLISILPSGTPGSLAAWIILPILTIGGIIAVQRVVKRTKEQLVYPRTGFIDYSTKPNPYRWFVIGGALAMVIIVTLLPYQWLNSESVAGGTLLFIILVTIGAQVGLRRLIVIGGLALVLGLGLAFLPGSEHGGLALTYTGGGLAILVSGGLAWKNYLAKNPLLREEG
jgi:hypothetical protein